MTPKLTDAEREQIAALLRGEDVANGIHDWRCSYPDQYGPCDCFAKCVQAAAETVEEILAARAARPVVDPEELARVLYIGNDPDGIGIVGPWESLHGSITAIWLELADRLLASGIFRDERAVKEEALREFVEIETHNGTPVNPGNLRWAATHEALCRSWIFDVLVGMADRLEGGAS